MAPWISMDSPKVLPKNYPVCCSGAWICTGLTKDYPKDLNAFHRAKFVGCTFNRPTKGRRASEVRTYQRCAPLQLVSRGVQANPEGPGASEWVSSPISSHSSQASHYYFGDPPAVATRMVGMEREVQAEFAPWNHIHIKVRDEPLFPFVTRPQFKARWVQWNRFGTTEHEMADIVKLWLEGKNGGDDARANLTDLEARLETNALEQLAGTTFAAMQDELHRQKDLIHKDVDDVLKVLDIEREFADIEREMVDIGERWQGGRISVGKALKLATTLNSQLKRQLKFQRQLSHDFVRFDGRIGSGDELHRGVMTLEDAKKKAVELEGCKGFCFKGSDAEKSEKVEVFFNSQCDMQQESTPWTSYKVVHVDLIGTLELSPGKYMVQALPDELAKRAEPIQKKVVQLRNILNIERRLEDLECQTIEIVASCFASRGDKAQTALRELDTLQCDDVFQIVSLELTPGKDIMREKGKEMSNRVKAIHERLNQNPCTSVPVNLGGDAGNAPPMFEPTDEWQDVPIGWEGDREGLQFGFSGSTGKQIVRLCSPSQNPCTSVPVNLGGDAGNAPPMFEPTDEWQDVPIGWEGDREGLQFGFSGSTGKEIVRLCSPSQNPCTSVPVNLGKGTSLSAESEERNASSADSGSRSASTASSFMINCEGWLVQEGDHLYLEESTECLRSSLRCASGSGLGQRPRRFLIAKSDKLVQQETDGSLTLNCELQPVSSDSAPPV